MIADDRVRVLRSALLPEELFVHGFPERGGGVSSGTRASLHLGAARGGDPAEIEENRRRVAAEAGFDVGELIATRHVHGTAVWKVGDPLAEDDSFDGLIADRPGAVLGAFAADCLPILFADPERRICGAAHAGWRGTVGRVAVNVVRAMERAGAAAGDIRVAIGPSIGRCCFEVGPEVVREFELSFPGTDGLIVDGARRQHIDLRVATRSQLETIGIRSAHIDDTPPCTMCHADRFFSYRRDGAGAGCHMGFIGLR
jgi:hypothetical protein